LELGPHQKAAQEKAREARLAAEAVAGWGDDDVNLRIEYPEGRRTRAIEYGEESAQRLSELDLSTIRFLPDINGFAVTDSGEIEVRVRARQQHKLRSVPGFEDLDAQQGLFEDEILEEETFVPYRLPKRWRIVANREELGLELSPASLRFRTIYGSSTRIAFFTLKISGAKTGSTSESVAVVQRLSDAFFFDFDVRYRITLELFERPHHQLDAFSRKIAAPAEFPRNRYHPQPAALYRYGRSAGSLPLLAYLAFYQVLEFFFPIFTEEEITRRARQVLASPQFDLNDEVSLLGLVNAIKPSTRSSASEREQLRISIRRCFGPGELELTLSSTERIAKYFTEKPQPIASLAPLRLAPKSDVRDQVADRIYDIRCRIVHTKSEGGDAGVELLLPTGKEARSIGPDIDLIRLAAQQAIIAGAAPLDLK
jgi:hypothetical protein